MPPELLIYRWRTDTQKVITVSIGLKVYSVLESKRAWVYVFVTNIIRKISWQLLRRVCGLLGSVLNCLKLGRVARLSQQEGSMQCVLKWWSICIVSEWIKLTRCTTRWLSAFKKIKVNWSYTYSFGDANRANFSFSVFLFFWKKSREERWLPIIKKRHIPECLLDVPHFKSQAVFVLEKGV